MWVLVDVLKQRLVHNELLELNFVELLEWTRVNPQVFPVLFKQKLFEKC